MSKYTPVIGLEVHVELNTKSKMFCGCANDWFGTTPNTRTCPVCLGLPGALPVPNKKAIESCIKIGMALNCEIPLVSKFDRKNYFYPDLAKGYQISQYDQPFAENGWMTLSTGKKIRIVRAHMEEDTGKLMHETVDGEKVSLIDFNRSGVPLVEIVTGPDFESAAEVKEYLQKLQQIVRYLGVARADMDKGEMRLEPNISLRATLKEGPKEPNGTEEPKAIDSLLPPYKVEVKNINSFSFVERAIAYEVERQAAILDTGAFPKQETRGWDEDKKMTISQRSKEEAADYRYFPEPDIPPITWSESQISNFKFQIPELPDAKKDRFEKEYALSHYLAELLTKSKDLADYFEEVIVILGKHEMLTPESIKGHDSGQARMTGDITPTAVANWIINKKVAIEEILPAQLIQQIVAATAVSGISDEELDKVLRQIISQQEAVVEDYKKGKTNALMFLVGQAMKELKGKAKADVVKSALEKLLS